MVTLSQVAVNQLFVNIVGKLDMLEVAAFGSAALAENDSDN